MTQLTPFEPARDAVDRSGNSYEQLHGVRLATLAESPPTHTTRSGNTTPPRTSYASTDVSSATPILPPTTFQDDYSRQSILGHERPTAAHMPPQQGPPRHHIGTIYERRRNRWNESEPAACVTTSDEVAYQEFVDRWVHSPFEDLTGRNEFTRHGTERKGFVNRGIDETRFSPSNMGSVYEFLLPSPTSSVYRQTNTQNLRDHVEASELSYSNYSNNGTPKNLRNRDWQPRVRFRGASYVEPSDQGTDDRSYKSESEEIDKPLSPTSEVGVSSVEIAEDQLLTIPLSLISLGGHILKLHDFLRPGPHLILWKVTTNPVDFALYSDKSRLERLPTSIASLPATQPPLRAMQLAFEKDIYPHTHTVWGPSGQDSYVTVGDVLLGINQACSKQITLEQWLNLDTQSEDRYEREHARRVKMMARQGKDYTALKWADTLGGRVYFGGLSRNAYNNMHGLITWTVKLNY